jgi:hypothetical protein
VEEKVEGVPVAGVAEPRRRCGAGRASGQPLQALRRDGREVAGELRVLGQHRRAARHERVDQPLPLVAAFLPARRRRRHGIRALERLTLRTANSLLQLDLGCAAEIGGEKDRGKGGGGDFLGFLVPGQSIE